MEHLFAKELRSPLSSDASFSRLSSLLRVSSQKQLDFPLIHSSARELIERMFPGGPDPFTHPDCLEEALALATEFQLQSVSVMRRSLQTEHIFTR